MQEDEEASAAAAAAEAARAMVVDTTPNAIPNAIDEGDPALFEQLPSSVMVVCDPDWMPDFQWTELNARDKAKAELKFEKDKNSKGKRWDRNDPKDIEQIKHKIAMTTMEQWYRNSKDLPDYKCCARSLKPEEEARLAELRKKIDVARKRLGKPTNAAGAVTARTYADEQTQKYLEYANKLTNAEDLEAMKVNIKEEAKEKNMEEVHLLSAAYTVINRGSMDTVSTVETDDTLTALATDMGINQDQMINDYKDFMNEERRRIVHTIRDANKRLANGSNGTFVFASKQDLEQQMHSDAKKEYKLLFQSDMVVVEPDAGSDGWEKTELGTLKHCGGCDDIQPIIFDSENEGLQDYSVRGDYSVDTVACTALIANPVKTTSDAVEDLRTRFRGAPCKFWKFPEPYTEGYCLAAKRTRELRYELGLVNGYVWKYADAFEADPFISVKEAQPGGGADKALLTQLHEYWHPTLLGGKLVNYTITGSASGKYAINNLRIELLRAYPFTMPEGKINSLMDFVCWFYKTITTPGTKLDGKDVVRPNASQTQRMTLLYQVLCAPNCTGGGAAKEMEGPAQTIQGWRKGVHERFLILVKWFEGIRLALDYDVFLTHPNKSVLWNGGGVAYYAAIRDFETKNKDVKDLQEADTVDVDTDMAAAMFALQEATAKLQKLLPPSPDDKAQGRALYAKWRKYNPLK